MQKAVSRHSEDITVSRLFGEGIIQIAEVAAALPRHAASILPELFCDPCSLNNGAHKDHVLLLAAGIHGAAACGLKTYASSFYIEASF